MRTRFFCSLLALLVAPLLGLSPTLSAQDCTTRWTNAGGGDWSNASNWSDGVPTTTDRACVLLAGTYTVTANRIDAGALFMGGDTGTQTLVLTGGIALTEPSTLGPNAVVDWQSGYLEAGTLVNQGRVRFTGSSGSRGARGATAVLRNTGTMAWEGAGILYVYNGARLENAGAFDVSGTGSLRGLGNVAGTFVTESGATLTKTGEALWEIYGNLTIENAGTWSVQGGTVEIEEASTHRSATLAVAEDARLQFNQPLTVEGTLTSAPAGQLVLSAAINAGAGAALAVTGTGFEWLSGYLEAGTLVNRNLVRFTGSSGNRGARGATAVLRNTGTMAWEGAGILYVYNGARLENAGAFDVSGTGSLRGLGNVAGTFVTESGATLTKTGEALWEIYGNLTIENAGTWSVQGGTVEIEEASTHRSATLAVAEDARLQFNQPLTVEGTLTSAPAGQLVLSAAINAGAGAALAVTGTGFEWLSGYLEAGTLVNQGRVRFTGSSGSRGARGATAVLRNTGTMAWEGAGILYVYNGARLENAGAFDVSGTGSLRGLGNVAGTFVTESGATLTKTGEALWEIYGNLTIENAGTWSVQGGTVEIEEASTHRSATLAVAEDARLQFNQPLTVEGTLTSAPAGRLVLSAAINAGAGAALAVTGTGFEWLSGYLEAGTLVNQGRVRFTGSSGSRGARGATAVLRNTGTMAWEGAGILYVYNGARLENAGAFDVSGTGSLRGLGNGGGAFVTESGATLTKTGEALWEIYGALAVENAGTWTVAGGAVELEEPSIHRNAVIDVAEDARLQFNQRLFVLGTLTSAPAGQLVLNAELVTDRNATLAVTEQGLEWRSGYLTSGTVLNRGRIRLTTATSSRGVRGDEAVLRNTGTMEWRDDGFFYVYDGARFENAATLDVVGNGGLRGFSGFGQFVNTPTGTFTRQGDDVFFFGTDIDRNRSFEPLDATLDGTVQLGGEIDAVGLALANRAAFDATGPDGGIGLLTWTGDLPFNEASTLRLDLAGAEASDAVVLLPNARRTATGTAQLDGALDVVLRNGYVPEFGTSFDLITAEALTGGFTDLTSLTVESANLSLYPTGTAQLFRVTAAEGIPTISGNLTAAPADAVNGRVVPVVLAGTGFAPDLTVSLECLDCVDPDEAGLFRGQVVTMTTTQIDVRFDLRVGDIVGAYEIVLRDPRGGTARTPFDVNQGPPVVTVTALDPSASEDGLDPGAFLVRTNRPLDVALLLPITLSGSAGLFTDYVPDVLGGTLVFPAGTDSVAVSVFPISDDDTESTESVTLSVTYTNPEPASLAATVQITDGPATDVFDVYAATPSLVGNLGTFTVTVGGQGFTDATTAQLIGAGPPITPYRVQADTSGTILYASFLLTGEAEGTRDLAVSEGGMDERLLNALTIESAVFPEVFVQVQAPARVPRTRERAYTVLLQNKGNVSTKGFAALSGLPPGTDWRIEDPEATVANSAATWRDVAPIIQGMGPDGDEVYIVALPTIVLAPRETRRLTLYAAIDTPQTLQFIASWKYEK